MPSDESERPNPNPNRSRSRSRAALLALAVVVAIALAGCSGLGGPDVTDDAAKERALTAEEQYLTARFENASCVEDWGLQSFTGIDREATVVNRTTDGLYVDVTQPFWYSTAEVEADVSSEATYLVTRDDVARVAGREIKPC
jgi:hypothetical protein